MATQPQHTYVGGYGIGRSGFYREWTPCGPVPTEADWDRWAEKATKKGVKPRRDASGKWVWVANGQTTPPVGIRDSETADAGSAQGRVTGSPGSLAAAGIESRQDSVGEA